MSVLLPDLELVFIEPDGVGGQYGQIDVHEHASVGRGRSCIVLCGKNQLVYTGTHLRARAAQGDLEQLILNLATNAKDAMPAGGALSIRTERTGDKLVITIRDTGCGILASCPAN